MKNIDRERRTHRLPSVASAKCFRKMYDVIDNSTIALEWLDTTLAEVKYQPDMRTYSLIKIFIRAAFTSCVILEGYNCVNTGREPDLGELGQRLLIILDYKPANILLSGIHTSRVTAKVGDLGLGEHILIDETRFY